MEQSGSNHRHYDIDVEILSVGGVKLSSGTGTKDLLAAEVNDFFDKLQNPLHINKAKVDSPSA